MKLLRYGSPGEEKPGILASDGHIRDLSSIISDVAGRWLLPESMDKLLSHQWRGNLRELNHVVRTMVLFCEGNVVLPDHVFFPEDLSSDLNELPAASAPRPAEPPPSAADDLTLSAAALRHIRFVHQQAQGNQRRTAKLLGISRATLARHLKNGHGGK